MTSDWKRLSVKEAAAFFQTSEDTILRRIRARYLHGSKDNRGKWHVLIKPDDTASSPQPSAVRRTDTTPHTAVNAVSSTDVRYASLDDIRVLLGEVQERHSLEIQRVLQMVANERQLLIERIDAAEIRAERAEDTINKMLLNKEGPSVTAGSFNLVRWLFRK